MQSITRIGGCSRRGKTEISKLQMEIYAGVGAGVESDSKGIVAEKELLQMMLDLGK